MVVELGNGRSILNKNCRKIRGGTMDGKLRNMTSVYIRKQDDGVVFIAL